MAHVVQVTRFGGPGVLATIAVPDPEPGPGEVTIAVCAADVLFLDAVIRSGQTFPLHQAAAAHTALEGRSALGKTLQTVP